MHKSIFHLPKYCQRFVKKFEDERNTVRATFNISGQRIKLQLNFEAGNKVKSNFFFVISFKPFRRPLFPRKLKNRPPLYIDIVERLRADYVLAKLLRDIGLTKINERMIFSQPNVLKKENYPTEMRKISFPGPLNGVRFISHVHSPNHVFSFWHSVQDGPQNRR